MYKILKVGVLSVVGLMLAVVVTGAVQAAQPGTTAIFNAYDNVQLHYGVGSESDFLRLGVSGEKGNSIEVCEDGQLVDLWFYVHNSTAASANGTDFDGPGVATGTVVDLDVDQDSVARSHSVVASIDSDQTNPITDSVTVTCADKDIQLVYKAVTYFGTTAPALTDFGNFSLVGELIDGASLGYQEGDRGEGVVPGCWQYRARLNIQLQVLEVEDEEEEVIEEEEDEAEEEEAEEEEAEEEEEIISETGGGQAITPALAMLVLSASVLAAWGHRAVFARRE